MLAILPLIMRFSIVGLQIRVGEDAAMSASTAIRVCIGIGCRRLNIQHVARKLVPEFGLRRCGKMYAKTAAIKQKMP